MNIPIPPGIKDKLHKLGAFLGTLLVLSMLGNWLFPLSPVDDRMPWFERHTYLSGVYPFFIPYFLMLPDNYDPAKKYPLVLVLHGATKIPHGARIAAEDYLREHYPAIILAPMAPFHRDWSTPDIQHPGQNRGQNRGGSIFDSLGLAMEILAKVEKKYAVDPDRIYVTGSSLGGVGSFGAVYYYPDKFAAAVPVAGAWAAKDVSGMTKTPIWAWHDQYDPVIPSILSRSIIQKIIDEGGRHARLNLIHGQGHGAWRDVYRRKEMWEWMFSQSRHPAPEQDGPEDSPVPDKIITIDFLARHAIEGKNPALCRCGTDQPEACPQCDGSSPCPCP